MHFIALVQALLYTILKIITVGLKMTFEELRAYYVTGYKFNKETKMSASCWVNWKRLGFIPIESQVKIQKITKGELKAGLGHLGE